jgi:hypothetical protein
MEVCSNVTFRYNPEKAGTTEFGHSRVHDVDDKIEIVKTCHNACGCCGVALLAILAVGAAIIMSGSSAPSISHCWEVCTYNADGVGVCQCWFH